MATPLSYVTLTQAYDLAKDLFNVDRGRNLESSKEMADYNYGIWGQQFDRMKAAQEFLVHHQYNYDKALQDASFQYGKENLERQIAANKEMMDIAQGYNTSNMDKQFQMNAYMSNIGRNIAAERANGINPSSSSPGSGSVTLPSTSPLGVGMPSNPSGSVGSAAAPNPSGVSSAVSSNQIFSASETARNVAVAHREESAAQNQDIQNMTQLIRDRMKIRESIADIKVKYSESNKMDKETSLYLKQLEYADRDYEAKIEELRKRGNMHEDIGSAAKETASAASSQASTAAGQLSETERHNRAIESIDRQKNVLTKYGLSLDERRVQQLEKQTPALIDELESRAKNWSSQKNLNDAELKWIDEKFESMIELQEAEAEKIRQQARKEKMDADTYYWRMIYDQTMGVLNSVPALKGAKALRDVIGNHVADKAYKRNANRFSETSYTD